MQIENGQQRIRKFVMALFVASLAIGCDTARFAMVSVDSDRDVSLSWSDLDGGPVKSRYVCQRMDGGGIPGVALFQIGRTNSTRAGVWPPVIEVSAEGLKMRLERVLSERGEVLGYSHRGSERFFPLDAQGTKYRFVYKRSEEIRVAKPREKGNYPGVGPLLRVAIDWEGSDSQ